MVVLDAPHRLRELLEGELTAGPAPGVGAPGTVRRGVQGELAAQALDDVRRGAHRARDQARLARTGGDGALAREPHLPAEVLLALGVVVVAVDLLQPLHPGAGPPLEAGHHPVHHLLAVEQRVGLRPAHLAHVVVELVGALLEVGQVALVVGQPDPEGAAPVARDPDVVLGDLVADAAGAGVQEQPDRPVLVARHLEEVVARAQGAELVAPGAGVGRGPQVDLVGQLGEPVDALLGVAAPDPLVGRAGRQRDGVRDHPAHARPVLRQVVGVQLGAHRDHAAADVDADRGRHDRAVGGDDRPDGRAEPQVGVGHEGHVRADEGHPRRPLGLLPGLRVEHRCPAQQPVADLLHGAQARRPGPRRAHPRGGRARRCGCRAGRRRGRPRRPPHTGPRRACARPAAGRTAAGRGRA